MSDEEITYAAVRFHKSSSELQNGGKPDEAQGPREAGHRECSVLWHLVAILLGILCSILLVAIAVLVRHIFQYSQEKHELQRALNNLQQEHSTMQNESYLREEMWRNKSTECDVRKDHLESLNRKQNRCYRETEVVLDCKQRTGKHVEGHWFCCGIKCYYFITGEKSWNGCKQTCQNCNLSLLLIEDNDELKFLQLQIKPNNYWIGLSYNTSKSKWQRIGDVPSKLDSNIANFNPKLGSCAFLSKTRLDTDSCDKSYTCICEKRLDKFPDSLCSKRQRTESSVQTKRQTGKG